MDIKVIVAFNVKGGAQLTPASDIAKVIKADYGYNYDSQFVETMNCFTWAGSSYRYDTSVIEQRVKELAEDYKVILIYNKNDKMPKQFYNTPSQNYNAMANRLNQSSKEDYDDAMFSMSFYEPLAKGKVNDPGHMEAQRLANNLSGIATVVRYGYSIGRYTVEPDFIYHVDNEGTYRSLAKQEVRPYAAKGCDKEVADLCFKPEAFGIVVDWDVIYYKGHFSRFRDTECESEGFNGFVTDVEDCDESVFDEDCEDPDSWIDEEAPEYSVYTEEEEVNTDEYTVYSSDQERQVAALEDSIVEYNYESDGMEYAPHCDIPIAYDDYFNEELTRNDWYRYRAEAEAIIEEDWEKFADYCDAWNQYLKELDAWKASQRKLKVELKQNETKIVRRGSYLKPPVFVYKSNK